MNDIQLLKTGMGIEEKYDWSFNHNDINIIRGNRQLVNAVRHAILLRQGELAQEIYQNKGCNAYEYKYDGNTRSGQIQLCGEIESAAKSVHGVYNATATVVEDGVADTRIQVDIITTSMEEVTVDGI